MKNVYLVAIFLVVLLALFLRFRGGNQLSAVQAEATPDPQTLVIKGSDTEVQLVSQLAEAFRAESPEANITVTGGGSGVGIAALINGEADLANSSRPMKDEEWQQATAAGRQVQEFIMARDVLSIIVHPQNKLANLTVDQLGKIYRGEIKNWSEVGGAKVPIILYGRQSTSGTFVYFRDTVLKAEYDEGMRNLEGSQSIVEAVKNDPNGIGYVGVGYVREADGQTKEGLKVLELDGFSPLDRTALDEGTYPLSRPLFQYLARLPEAGSPMAQFIIFEASERGQQEVERSGFYPLTADDVRRNQALLDAVR